MICRETQRFRRADGFTLMELIVVIVIMGILALVVTGITSLSARTFSRIFNSTQVRWELRTAMEQLQHDFQRLSPDSLLRIEPSRVTFYDIDHQYIDIQLARGELRRNGAVILSHVVNSDVFTYFNQDMQIVTGGSGDDDGVDDDKWSAASSLTVPSREEKTNRYYLNKKRHGRGHGHHDDDGGDDGDDDLKKRKHYPYHEVAFIAVNLKISLNGHEGTLQELFYVRN